MRLPATGIGLALGALLPHAAWLRPLVMANALVGLVYMIVEWRALRDVGMDVMGVGRVRWSLGQQWVVNVVSHGVLTCLVLSRMPRAAADAQCVWLVEAAGVLLLDLDRVYPTAGGSVLPYVLAHAAVVAAAMCMM